MVNINIKKLIFNCNYIVFSLELLILLLQNKEFSPYKKFFIFTKLIPKGLKKIEDFVLGEKSYQLKPCINELGLDLVNSSSSFFVQKNKEVFILKTQTEGTSVFFDKKKTVFFDNGTAGSAGKEMQLKLKPLLFEYLIEKKNQSSLPFASADKKNLFLREGLDLFFDTKKTENKKFLNYNFSPGTEGVVGENFLFLDLIKLLNAFFKSIFCIISRPKFINTPDKITIEILYYITIPNNNIFKWYNFIYKTKKVIAHNFISLGESKDPSFSEKKQIGSKLKTQLKKVNKQKLRVQKWNRFIKIILKKNFLVKKMLFNLNKTNITNLYYSKFIILFKLLSSYFNKPIEFNLIRLHKADYDSNILAKLFFLILKRKNIKSAIRKIYFKNKIGMIIEGKDINLIAPKKKKLAKLIPAYISGLYVHIGGRLIKERIVPKRTTKKFEKGAIATGKVNFLDTARISKKNKKGAFTIKIAFAQNFRFEN